MQKLKSINKDHEKICYDLLKYIEGQVYQATEDMPSEKYEDYTPIKEAICITYNEAFDNINKGSFTVDEVVYMLPNLLLFSFSGFLAGMNDKYNSERLQEIHDKTAEKCAIFVSDLTDLLDELCSKQK